MTNKTKRQDIDSRAFSLLDESFNTLKREIVLRSDVAGFGQPERANRSTLITPATRVDLLPLISRTSVEGEHGIPVVWVVARSPGPCRRHGQCNLARRIVVDLFGKGEHRVSGVFCEEEVA
jgi:hypothetical protein